MPALPIKAISAASFAASSARRPTSTDSTNSRKESTPVLEILRCTALILLRFWKLHLGRSRPGSQPLQIPPIIKMRSSYHPPIARHSNWLRFLSTSRCLPALILIAQAACWPSSARSESRSPSSSLDEQAFPPIARSAPLTPKVLSLLAALSLDEKISLVHGAEPNPISVGNVGFLPGSVATLQLPRGRFAGCSSWRLRFAVYSNGVNSSRRSSSWQWDGICDSRFRTATSRSYWPSVGSRWITSPSGAGTVEVQGHRAARP
jgi:hypothetical protein